MCTKNKKKPEITMITLNKRRQTPKQLYKFTRLKGIERDKDLP